MQEDIIKLVLFIKKNIEKVILFFIKFVTIISILPILFILGYLIFKGLPSVSWTFLSQMPSEGMREGGIMPAIVGTMILTIGTIIIAVPFGVLTGIYLVEYSKDNWMRRVINITIVNLAGIPSIIYGLFGMAFFVITLKFQSSIIAGCMTLGVMSLPVIITATRESLLALSKDLREASLALGATKWETIWRVILPASTPGIVTGVILAISRAAGETAPILFTVAAFYLPFLPDPKSLPSGLGFLSKIIPESAGFYFDQTFGWLNDQVMALPYHLYIIATQVPNMPKGNMFATAFLLVSITVGFNLIGAYIRNKFRRGNK